MRYQDYKKRLLKIRKVLDVFYHLRFVFLGVAIVTAASITTLDLTKGNITEVSEFQISYTYGEDIKYSGSAFMGDVSFEFRKFGNQDWIEDKPYLVGKYEARAKSLGNHGYKYSNVSTFEIKPYQVDINIAVSKVDYGNEHPKLEYKLLANDVLNEKDVVVTYADLTKNTTTASIDLDSIKVSDKNGNDITYCYTFTTEDKEITFNKVNINVNFANASTYSYTGESHTNNEYTVSGEFPYPDDDKLVVDGGIEVSEIGVHNNNHTAKVMTNGVENENYVVNVKDNSITITKAPAITISSKSLSKTYDGETFEDEEFELDDLSISPADGLLPGHHLKLVEFVNKDQWKVCSNVNNEFNFDIVDNEGNHVEYEDLYQSVSKTYGKINISKKDVTITSKPLTAVFDNKYHSIPEIKSVEGLADGDEASVVLEGENYTKQLAPTTGVDNVLDYVIKRGEEDVTDNYNITKLYEKIVITRDTFRFKFNSINDTQGTITYDKHNYPYYYAVGTDDYQMFETDDDRYNAGVLDTTFKTLPEGWKYDVRIPSNTTMMEVKDGGYTANVSAIEYHIYDNSEPRLEVTNYYTSDNFIFGYFDGDEFKADELPTSSIMPKALNIVVDDRYDKEFNNRTLAQDMVIDPNNASSCVKYNGLLDGDYPDVKFANSTVTANRNASDTPYNVVFTYGVKDGTGTNAKDITHNYSITVNKDSIDAYISKKVITVEPVNISKTYDGTNTFTPKCTVTSATLGEVVTIKSNVQYETSSPNVNDPENPYRYTLNPEDIVINISNTNVTSNYEYEPVAILKSATVNITKRDIDISSNSNSNPSSHIYYDEKAHGVFMNTDGTSSKEMSIESAGAQNTRGLVNGHKVMIDNPQSITDPGVLEIANTANLGIRILDAENADVTANYAINQASFHIEIVKNYINIKVAYYWSKFYDGLPFEVPGLENVPYGEFRDYNSPEMSLLYDVTFEAFAPGAEPLQPGHKLQVTKYKESTSNAFVHVGPIGVEGYYKFDYRVIDTNNGNADVTSQYNIDSEQNMVHFNIDQASFYVYCNNGEREYDGTKSTPPTSETFELTNTQSAPAYYFGDQFSTNFFTKYALRCKFDNGAYDPDEMWRIGTYKFNATITIYDKIDDVEYAYNALSDDIQINIIDGNYDAKISKRRIKLSVITYSNGKERRSISESSLASGDVMYFGNGVTFEEALKDGSRAYYTNAATLENIRIYRSGVDVTDCYDIKIEMTNNS